MIDLYTWPTPNGHKIHIMLEETGLEYTLHPINIQAGDQFDPEFLKISPNNKMPAMIDQDGPGAEPITMFESGAMLLYLADKTGRFMPSLEDDPHGHYNVLQWLMFQMGGIGPMLGQVHHFRNYASKRIAVEKIQYGIDRYVNEANRLYNVVDRRLGEAEYIAGAYSIADMAIFPWVRTTENQGIEADDYPNYQAWAQKIAARPAVGRALEILAEERRGAPATEESWDVLFGATQYAKR